MTPKTKTVLVVDDSETIRNQLAAALERAGFTVIEARDGMDGLECIENNTLSLVILDVNMPRLNGLDMLDRLKASGKNANLPVLLLTTEVQQSMIERAKKAGARGWMVKPVKMEQLVSAVTKLAG
jgi:two-component system chemotaxis response regulator CheY